MTQSPGGRTTDPDGRDVVFDAGTHLHLAQGCRAWLLDHVNAILATVELPDHREDDARPGRERFYRQHVLQPSRWLRVVVDFNVDPAWIATVLVQDQDPRANVEYDATGQVVGMTLVNVRWLLERDGELTITWPTGHVQADELAPALASAA